MNVNSVRVAKEYTSACTVFIRPQSKHRNVYTYKGGKGIIIKRNKNNMKSYIQIYTRDLKPTFSQSIINKHTKH